MNDSQIVKLKEIIRNVCKIENENGFVDEKLENENCDLKDDLGFDSLLFVELIVDIEDEFGFEFDLDLVDISKLRLFGELKAIVSQHLMEN